jgi:hypothetical protein
MKERWLMVCYGIILDTCLASSKEEASERFRLNSRYEDWAESDILSEADYLAEV